MSEDRFPTNEILRDLVNEVLLNGEPTITEDLQANVDFEIFPPKKKNRSFKSDLIFPKGSYIGMFKTKHQFHSVDSVIAAIKDYSDAGTTAPDVFDIKNYIEEMFPGEAIGVAGGPYFFDSEGINQNIGPVNILWLNKDTRVYYDPIIQQKVRCMPKIIVV